MKKLKCLVNVWWLLAMQKGEMGRFRYGGWWSVWWTGTYSMVLSKAAFFHSKYLDIYTNNMPSSISDYITKNRFLWSLFPFPLIPFMSLANFEFEFFRNCEDIAMSFLVANVSGAPPVWVQGTKLWIRIILEYILNYNKYFEDKRGKYLLHDKYIIRL